MKYNILNAQIKRKIFNFTNKIIGKLTKPQQKFIHDMIYGIISSSSCHLSEISRSLKENVKLAQTIDRLSDNLYKYNMSDLILDEHISSIKNHFNEDTNFYVDDSEVVKDCGKNFELLCKVRDGSDNGKIKPGYHVATIVGSTGNNNQPICAYTKLYSSEEKDFKSMPNETIKSIDKLTSIVGKIGTYVLDRGFDSSTFFNYFIKKGLKFIIRAKKNRSVEHQGKKVNVQELAKNLKGKINIKINFQDKEFKGKISYTKITIPSIKKELNKEVYLVIVKGMGQEPMMLYTNKEIKNKYDAIKVVRAYFGRWRIEEFFKLQKQQYGLEDIRVRSLQSIKNLHLLLNIALTIVGELATTVNVGVLVTQIIKAANGIKEKIYFWHYRIATGIKECLTHSITGIKGLYEQQQTLNKEWNLFTMNRIYC